MFFRRRGKRGILRRTPLNLEAILDYDQYELHIYLSTSLHHFMPGFLHLKWLLPAWRMLVDWLMEKPVFFFPIFRTLLFWTWLHRNPIIWMQLFWSLELYLMGNNSSVENYYSSLERSGCSALRCLTPVPFFLFCPSLMHCTITFKKNGAPPPLEYNFTRFLI